MDRRGLHGQLPTGVTSSLPDEAGRLRGLQERLSCGVPPLGDPAGGLGAPMAEALIPIVQRAYDFAVVLYGSVNRFPRAQTPLFGRERWGLALRRLVTVVTANRGRDRVPALEDASGAAAALRITLRLSTRLGLLSHTGYEVLLRDLDEIGRMRGGSRKAPR